jgi:type I restriction enzyme S subunit
VSVGKYTTEPTKISQQDDIVISIRASIGEKVWVESGHCLGRGVAAIRTTEKIDKNYLWHALSYVEPMLVAKGRGATFLQVNKEDIQNLEVPLPPFAEQQRIAAQLDTADRILRPREQAIAKLDQLAQSWFEEMFGDLRHPINDWPVVTLKEVCLNKGQYGAGLSAVEFDTDKPRYIRITDITEDGSLNDKVVSPSGSPVDWKDYFLKEGDVLFARSGATVGKTYLHKNGKTLFVYAGYLIKFSPNIKLIKPEFLFGLTKTEFYRTWVKTKQNVVAQPNINSNQYGNELMFPLPPIELQENFSQLFAKCEEQKKLMRAAKASHLKLINSLQHQAFTSN